MFQPNWFAEWFNSPYYHLLYKHRDCLEAENFIRQLLFYLKPNQESRFLDLACGKGRHSIFINKNNYNITGIDLSVESIRCAKQFENQKLNFFAHDMRVVFANDEFDFVLNLFTSFGYFESPEDDLLVIESVYKALKSNGIFVLDFFNSQKIISNLVKTENKKIEGIDFLISKKLENNFIIKEINFKDKGVEYNFCERVKALTLEDIQEYFSSVNFKIIDLFGDYDFKPFDINSSDRLILVAMKEN